MKHNTCIRLLDTSQNSNTYIFKFFHTQEHSKHPTHMGFLVSCLHNLVNPLSWSVIIKATTHVGKVALIHNFSSSPCLYPLTVLKIYILGSQSMKVHLCQLPSAPKGQLTNVLRQGLIWRRMTLNYTSI